MREIKLTKGFVAIVDDSDYEHLMQSKWYLHTSGTSDKKYARNSQGQMMHQVVLGLDPNDKREPDHIDGDGLNNRQANLRAVTHSQNIANAKPIRGKAFPYKGVFYHKRRRKFYAATTRHGMKVHVGVFQSLEDATTAYNFAAYELHGEFAFMNKPAQAQKEGTK